MQSKKSPLRRWLVQICSKPRQPAAHVFLTQTAYSWQQQGQSLLLIVHPLYNLKKMNGFQPSYFFNLSCLTNILGQFHGLSEQRTSLDSAAEIWKWLHQKGAFHDSFYFWGNMSQTLNKQFLAQRKYFCWTKEKHKTKFHRSVEMSTKTINQILMFAICLL